jgi:hypothetical protein
MKFSVYIHSEVRQHFELTVLIYKGQVLVHRTYILMCVFRENNIYREGISQFPDR